MTANLRRQATSKAAPSKDPVNPSLRGSGRKLMMAFFSYL